MSPLFNAVGASAPDFTSLEWDTCMFIFLKDNHVLRHNAMNIYDIFFYRI